MKAQILELGQCLGEHEVILDSDGNLKIQGIYALSWVWEVARDCTAIDEVRIHNGESWVSFSIDRDFEPARVTMSHSLTQRTA